MSSILRGTGLSYGVIDMLNSQIGSFIAVAVIIVITPGPDMLLVAKHTLASGRRAGVLTGLGVTAGLFVHALAAALGLSAILASSATAFTVVKVVGALYLISIGLRGVHAALTDTEAPDPVDEPTALINNQQRFRQGLLTNVLNPKVAIMFLSVLPQFVDADESVLAQTLLLSGSFILLGLAWLMVYSNVLAVAGERVLTYRRRQWIEGISGVVLVVLGVRLVTDR